MLVLVATAAVVEVAQPVVMAAASRMSPKLRFIPFRRCTAHDGSQSHGAGRFPFAGIDPFNRDNPHSGYRRLRAELDVLPAALAMTIDPSHPADSTLGTVALYVSRYPRRPRKPRTLAVVTG